MHTPARKTLSLAFSRGAPAFARLLLAATLPLCAGAGAQTLESVSIEGTPVKLAVPAGYCKLTREAPPGQDLYAAQERMQKGTNLVLLIFGDCGELAKTRSGGAMPHYGMYLAPLDNGHASKLPLTLSRGQAIDEVAKTVPALDTAAIQKMSNARTNTEGVSLDKMTSGLLGKDANAVYIGIAANASSGGQGARFHAVTLITFLKSMVVSAHLYAPVEPGAPFDKLWAVQKGQAAALVKAN